MRRGNRTWAWLVVGLAAAPWIAQAQPCRSGTVTVNGNSRIERRCYFTSPGLTFDGGQSGRWREPYGGVPCAPGSSTRPNRPFNEYDRDNDGKLDCWKSAAGKPSEARISSRYGASSWRPGNFHYGVDIASHTANFGLGQRVWAIADGEVTRGLPRPANGNYVQIVHGDGRVSLYLHLRDVLQFEGPVRAGDEIGTMNCTGNCGKPPWQNTVQSTHVHIEIKTSLEAPRTPANRIDPIAYLGNCQR